jgi:ATP-dependent RNA helicase DDX42
VATDVAARGLDVPGLRTVLNFEPARDADTHTHRVGRTGRAGATGCVAWTLLTAGDAAAARVLVAQLEGAYQPVSADLYALAMRDSRFRKNRAGRGGAGGRGPAGPRVGGRGIGFDDGGGFDVSVSAPAPRAGPAGVVGAAARWPPPPLLPLLATRCARTPQALHSDLGPAGPARQRGVRVVPQLVQVRVPSDESCG